MTHQPPVLVTVVVAARLAEADPTPVLRALAPQRAQDVEVVLASDGHVRDLPAWVRPVQVPDALVPELWAAALHVARGQVAALTASTLLPGPGWVSRARALAQDDRGRVAAVGGAFRGPDGGRALDRAVLYCRYSRFLDPLVDGATDEVPGDNALYRLDVLRRYEPVWRDGFWEPFVHARMVADGHLLAADSALVVAQARGLRLRGLLAQRYRHGRAHGRRRSEGQPPSRTRLAAATAPLVPPLMTVRALRAAWRHPAHRGPSARAVPWLLLLYGSWAVGELRGRLDAAREQR